MKLGKAVSWLMSNLQRCIFSKLEETMQLWFQEAELLIRLSVIQSA